jgi:hypothetical protein
MLMFKSYQCRFVEYKRPVYAVVKYNDTNTTKSFINSQFMTAPFRSATNAFDTYNVLLTFTCQRQAELFCDQLYNCDQVKTKPEPAQYILDNLSYLTSKLNIPLVVVLNSYCDIDTKEEHHEIFYTSRHLDDTYKDELYMDQY